MSTPALELTEYHGKYLTDIEIQLVKFYEQRERSKKELKDRQRQQHLQMSQNFNTISEIDPTRIETPKPKEKEPTPQVYETQRKLTPNPEQPSTKRFRISEDQTASHDPQTNILTPLHQTKLNVSTTPPIASHPQLSSQSDNKSKDPSNIKIHIKDIPTSSDIDIPDNELDPTIFPSNGLILTNDWNPRDEHANLGTSKVFLLDNFSVLKNQTLVFKITVPTDSKRWSINLGPPEMASKIDADNDQTWNNILYHFNPRYGGKKKELVQCDMNDGTWGVTDRRAFSAFSIIPTGNIQLMIQIRSDGIYTSINEMFFSYFKHRRDISEYRELALQLPLTDDPGNPENVIFHKIWWGRRDPKNTSDFIGYTSSATETLEQRNDLALSVFVGGLPRADTVETLNEIKNLLWEVFADYSPDDVNVIPGKGYGFIRMPSAQHALDAIKAVNGFEVVDEDDPNNHYKLVVSHARSRGI